MFGRMNQQGYVKTALRLPPQLHAALHQAAEQSGRSFNAELVSRLESTFASTEINAPPASASEKYVELLELTSSVLAFVALRFHDRIPERVKADPEVRLALQIVELLDGAAPLGAGPATAHRDGGKKDLMHVTFEQFQVRPRLRRGGWFSDALAELRALLVQD